MKEYLIQMKIGAITDVANRARISKMLRYYSTQSRGNMMLLNGYIALVKEDRKEFFYIRGENLADLKMSPLVKTVKENGYEVLYMTDHVDEAAAGSVDSFDEKKLVDLGKDGVKVPKTNCGCSPTVVDLGDSSRLQNVKTSKGLMDVAAVVVYFHTFPMSSTYARLYYSLSVDPDFLIPPCRLSMIPNRWSLSPPLVLSRSSVFACSLLSVLSLSQNGLVLSSSFLHYVDFQARLFIHCPPRPLCSTLIQMDSIISWRTRQRPSGQFSRIPELFHTSSSTGTVPG
mgnify:CR=1 FL=1